MALAGLVAASAFGGYLFYPDGETCLDQARTVKADALEAILNGRKEQALRQIPRWDDLTRRLEVGHYLRTGRLDDATHQAAEALREKLEEARDAFLAGTWTREKGTALTGELSNLHQQLRNAVKGAR